MYVQTEPLGVHLSYQTADLVLKLIRKEYGGSYGACSKAGGAGFVNRDIHHRTYSLTRNLHKAELTQRQYIVLGAVTLHILAHALVELLAVFGQRHVYEVDHDNAAHVAQSQLAGQFVGCSQIHLEGVLLLGAGLDAVAAVDIDHMKGLGMFNNKVGSALV